MNLQQIEELINENVGLITVDAKGLAEAGMRSAKFLVVCSILATYLKQLETELGKVDANTAAIFGQAVKNAIGKNITEKKTEAGMDPEVLKTAHLKSALDAQRTWIKTHIKIFENAHVMYRQFSRE